MRRFLTPPRTLRPTRAGWSFFAITFGVGFAALNTGNNLLYLVLSLMLAFLVLSGVLSESALRGIRVRRRLPREMFAGARNPVALEVRNCQRRIPAFAVVVEDRVRSSGAGPTAVGRVFAMRIAPGASVVCRYRFEPAARGVLEFQDFQVVTRFPFGLFSKALLLPAPGRATVYPQVEPVSIPAHFGGTRRAGEHVIEGTERGAAAAGLRDFVHGDPLRRIHWASSLRRRQLTVRQLETTREAEVEVRLRTRGAASGEAFERAVGWAASEVVALLDSGRRVTLRTDGTRLHADAGSGQRARLLSFLAFVQPGSAESA